jgi:hypothetical protein
MRTNKNHDAIDHIADTSRELAHVAADIGLESLVFILRMAEIEARKSIGSGQAPRKQNARMTSVP